MVYRKVQNSEILVNYHSHKIVVRLSKPWPVFVDRSGQPVKTQIRLLLEEQSEQGLHCLLFHLHVFDKIPSSLASLFEF